MTNMTYRSMNLHCNAVVISSVGLIWDCSHQIINNHLKTYSSATLYFFIPMLLKLQGIKEINIILL